MNQIKSIFLRGLVAVLPLALTIYVVYWCGYAAEYYLGAGIRVVLPDGWYVPGFGIVVSFVLVFITGILINTWLVQRFMDFLERTLDRVPFVKTIYSSMKDMLGFFSQRGTKDFGRVVMVDYPAFETRVLGFLTREEFDDLPRGIGGEGDVAVFIPMSYQLGGFTVIVSREQVETVNMNLEDGLKFALTAGVQMERDELPQDLEPPTDRKENDNDEL